MSMKNSKPIGTTASRRAEILLSIMASVLLGLTVDSAFWQGFAVGAAWQVAVIVALEVFRGKSRAMP
ncbi:hypothetical protein ACW9IB_01345 [Pseudomonas sp. SDO524_S393]